MVLIDLKQMMETERTRMHPLDFKTLKKIKVILCTNSTSFINFKEVKS